MKRFLPMLRRAIYLLILYLYCSSTVFSQQTVSGRIVDSTTQTALPGANILVKGTNRGAVSDASGNFSIQASVGDVLTISSVDYNTIEVTVTGAVLNIMMSNRNAQLDEVVVIGYGQRQRRDVTGAVASVSAQEIEKSTSPSPEMAMQGRMAGVFVATPSGNPNDRVTVRIRGVSTFNGPNDPLYVIDGVPLTEGGAGNPDPVVVDLRTPVNIFNLINPNDIESISVLKDASAAAIYGVRAANGVVLITTKRGKGKPRIELNTTYGIQNSVSEGQPLLSTAQFMTLYNEAYNNNPNRTGGTVVPIGQAFGPEFDPASPAYLGNSPTYDWQTEYLNRNAPYRNVNLKLSGATESLNYYISGDYFSTEGTLVGTKTDRYSLALNLNSKVSKVLEVGVTARGIYSRAENQAVSLSVPLRITPWQPIYGDGPGGYAPVNTASFVPYQPGPGQPPYDPLNVNTPAPYNTTTGQNPALIWGLQTKNNELGLVDLNDNTYHTTRALGNGYIQVTPLPGLRIRGSLYGDFIIDRNTSLSMFDAWRFSSTPQNPYNTAPYRYDTNLVANFGTRNKISHSYTKEIAATYNATFGDNHSLELTGVANHQEWRWAMLSSSAGLASADPARRNTSNSSLLVQSGGYNANWEGTRALIGYVGRVSYKFADKYYIDATVRRDGSSRFAPENRWGTFPAVALAWRVTNEDFFAQRRRMTWLNDLKIRANWGQLGNEQNTFGWRYLTIVNPGITVPNYSTGSGNGNALGTQQLGAYLPDFANRDLSWETVTTSGIGFDAVLFNNRLNLTVEYYNRVTNDIIQSVAPPLSSGIQNNIDLNVGEVLNRGIEVAASYGARLGPVNFNFQGNFTTTKNEVLSLYNGVNFSDNVFEGYPIGFIRGYRVGGIFQNQQQIDEWRARYADVIVGQSPTNPTAGYQPQPGDMYFLDVARQGEAGKFNTQSDSLINTNDRVYLGNTIPGFFYGFGFNASVKNFELSVLFQGVGDVQRVNNVRIAGENMSSNGLGQLATTLNRWTPTNPSETMPRAVFNDPNQNNRFSDRFVENAGFMRLKNIELAYRFPSSVLSRTNAIQGLRLFVSGINLLTFTSYSGLDPENDFYPPMKQINFGLNATF